MAARTVLIVEDDDRLGHVVQRSLERAGHSVRLVATGAAARVALAEARPEVLLLDVDLPDGTGWEVLRERPDAAGVIVVMSAGQPARRRLEEFRSACFLGKPFAIDALLDLIARGDAMDAAVDDRGAPMSRSMGVEDA
jgi:DNA-binding response OmpR family regulator